MHRSCNGSSPPPDDVPSDRSATALTVAVVVIATSILVGSVVAATVPAGQAIVVSDATSGERLLAVPVENGSTVTVSYTHSVERTPVRDVYTVDGQRLTMARMEFSSYGYGLPSDAEVELVDGQFVTYPEWSGARLTVNPGHIAGHQLAVDGRTYDLVRLSDAKAVTIRVVDVSLLDRLLDRTDGPRPSTTTPEKRG